MERYYPDLWKIAHHIGLLLIKQQARTPLGYRCVTYLSLFPVPFEGSSLTIHYYDYPLLGEGIDLLEVSLSISFKLCC